MKVQNCQIWRSGTEGLKYYSVRGTALLWISEKYHDIIEPLATSHNYKETLQEKFFDQGTDEMTNFFVIEEALKYYEKIGGMKFLHEHARNLLEGLRAVFEISAIWPRAGPTWSKNFSAPGRLGPKIPTGRAGPTWAENVSGPGRLGPKILPGRADFHKNKYDVK